MSVSVILVLVRVSATLDIGIGQMSDIGQNMGQNGNIGIFGQYVAINLFECNKPSDKITKSDCLCLKKCQIYYIKTNR